MPIYEFYCCDCHAVYNFLSRRPNTRKRPACPRCGRPKLNRKISRFAVVKTRAESSEASDDDLPPGFDESKMERVMEQMAHEMDNVNEDDPRQMARMMRKLYDGTGLPMGDGMQEAIRRMEAGEDPDKIEEEMGDVLEQEDALFGEGGEMPEGGGKKLQTLSRRLRPPAVDETLYDL